jgi:hypothetical protein
MAKERELSAQAKLEQAEAVLIAQMGRMAYGMYQSFIENGFQEFQALMLTNTYVASYTAALVGTAYGAEKKESK